MYDHQYNQLLLRLVSFLTFLVSCNSSPLPKEPPKEEGNTPKSVLIINSDQSVKKYALIHEAFKSKLSADAPSIKIEEINLADIFSVDTIKRRIGIFQRPDIIHAIGSDAYELAKDAVQNTMTNKKPVIVFSGIFDWHRFEKDMGSKTYGMALELPADLQLILIMDIFPNMSTLGVLYSQPHNQKWFEETRSEAEEMELSLRGKIIGSSNDISNALAELIPHVDAIWLIPDPIVLKYKQNVSTIFQQASAQQKPILTYAKSEKHDAVLILQAKLSTIGEQLAGSVKNILKTGDIPKNVQEPSGSRVLLNKKKAIEYGIEITDDPDILSEVELIE